MWRSTELWTPSPAGILSATCGDPCQKQPGASGRVINRGPRSDACPNIAIIRPCDVCNALGMAGKQRPTISGLQFRKKTACASILRQERQSAIGHVLGSDCRTTRPSPIPSIRNDFTSRSLISATMPCCRFSTSPENSSEESGHDLNCG